MEQQYISDVEAIKLGAFEARSIFSAPASY